VDELKSYREKIDSLDRELVRLFLERMEVVKNIARYKKENHIPVLDSGREAECSTK
jgi:chorismate mutase/prephenate dehydratase